MKESGYGREGSTHGLADYLHTQYLCQGGLDCTTGPQMRRGKPFEDEAAATALTLPAQLLNTSSCGW